jgi:hypothetical protein
VIPLLLLRRKGVIGAPSISTTLNSTQLISTPLHHRLYTTNPRSHAVRSTQIPAQPRSLEQHTRTHPVVDTSLPPPKPLCTLRSMLAPIEKEEISRTEEEVKNNKRLPWKTGVENADENPPIQKRLLSRPKIPNRWSKGPQKTPKQDAI